MPPRKRTSSVLNGDSAIAPNDVDQVTDHDDALSLAEEAEAEAAEAEALANAARARARAIRLRRQAAASAASAASTVPAAEKSAVAEPAEVEEIEADEIGGVTDESTNTRHAETTDDSPAAEAAPAEAEDVEDVQDTEDLQDVEDAEPKAVRRRRLRLPPIRLKVLAAGLVILCTLALLGVSVAMFVHHRGVTDRQHRSTEFAAAARQGVVTLMSLDFNHAADDVKRIIDNTTGDFKKDFEGQAGEFTKVAQESKVVTEATVNATAVQSMTQDTATVLVAVTTNVSNAASKQQQPRSWRLRVNVARDGGQIKLAKVEFVP